MKVLNKIKFNKNWLILIIIFIIRINVPKRNKICICTVGKLENLYIREFVEYYKKLGVDKLFISDNNEFNGEKFEDVIGDYINNKFVEILNYRGKRGNLIKIMDNCYQKNYLIKNHNHLQLWTRKSNNK